MNDPPSSPPPSSPETHGHELLKPSSITHRNERVLTRWGLWEEEEDGEREFDLGLKAAFDARRVRGS